MNQGYKCILIRKKSVKNLVNWTQWTVSKDLPPNFELQQCPTLYFVLTDYPFKRCFQKHFEGQNLVTLAL